MSYIVWDIGSIMIQVNSMHTIHTNNDHSKISQNK